MNNISNLPKICVAICHYNHQQYLKDSIDSIINQKYQDLDIVIVDDCSTNQQEFLDIVNSYNDPRIRIKTFEKNLGKWACLNYAFETTKADLCTSHDADDISLNWRIGYQLFAMMNTNSIHNLCGFVHCYNQEDIEKNKNNQIESQMKIMGQEEVNRLVNFSLNYPQIKHYFTGDFETAGVSSMFVKNIWDLGIRFNPPKIGLRTLLSEDSDFNYRVTRIFGNTSVLMEKPYLYRRHTSTNKEEF